MREGGQLSIDDVEEGEEEGGRVVRSFEIKGDMVGWGMGGQRGWPVGSKVHPLFHSHTVSCLLPCSLWDDAWCLGYS